MHQGLLNYKINQIQYLIKIYLNKSLKTSITDLSEVATQTDVLTLREFEGLDKALQSFCGELTNNFARLTDTEKDLAKEEQKIARG